MSPNLSQWFPISVCILSALGGVITGVSTLSTLMDSTIPNIYLAPIDLHNFASQPRYQAILQIFPHLCLTILCLELAKEGIPLPFGNKFWASNWPTGKSPFPGLIIHLIPTVRKSWASLSLSHRLFEQVIIIIAPPAAVAYPFILDVEGYPQQIINFFVVCVSVIFTIFFFQRNSTVSMQGLFWMRWKKPNIHRPFKGMSTYLLHLFSQNNNLCQSGCPLLSSSSPQPYFVSLLQQSMFSSSLFCVRFPLQSCLKLVIIAPFLRPSNHVGDTPPLPYFLSVTLSFAFMLGFFSLKIN